MNKKIIIFGGSSGLGLELAKTFGQYQKEIIISSSNEIRLKKTHQILDEVLSAVSQWKKIAREIEIPKNQIDKINTNLRITELLK